MYNYDIFDMHTHIYPVNLANKASKNLGEFYDFKVTGKGTYNDLIKYKNQCNVGGYLILGVATDAEQVTNVNTYISRICSNSYKDGTRTFGFASMHQDYEDVEQEVERCLRIGLLGFKIHPDIQHVNIDDTRLFRLYKILEKNKIPINFHLGDNRPEFRFSEPRKLYNIIEKFPDLIVVASHLGGYKAWDESIKYLKNIKRIWYDCSSTLWAISPQKAKEIMYTLGKDRIMFGTDYPVKTIPETIELFKKLDLDKKTEKEILHDTPLSFLKSCHAKL